MFERQHSSAWLPARRDEKYGSGTKEGRQQTGLTHKDRERTRGQHCACHLLASPTTLHLQPLCIPHHFASPTTLLGPRLAVGLHQHCKAHDGFCRPTHIRQAAAQGRTQQLFPSVHSALRRCQCREQQIQPQADGKMIPASPIAPQRTASMKGRGMCTGAFLCGHHTKSITEQFVQ